MPRSGFPVGVLLLGALGAQGAGAQDQAATTVAQPAAAAATRPAAAAPVPDTVDARSLGVAEAMLDYCTTNDPTGAAKVHERLKQLMKGASKEALAEARKSAEYRRAHDSELDFIGKVDSHNAQRLCSGFASEARARSK